MMSLSPAVPNPPGPIDILTKTTSSIGMRWKEAPLVTVASFQYRLTITSHEAEVYIPGNNTHHTFASLLSGTSYNISVATVGAMGFESEEVQIHLVNTSKGLYFCTPKNVKAQAFTDLYLLSCNNYISQMSSFKQSGPFSVKYLNASTKEEGITVMWFKPDEYKGSYRYNVTWQSSDGANSVMTEDNEYDISNLVPGRRYKVSVTTETSDGTQGASRWISICTGVVITDLLVSYRQIFSNKFVFQLQYIVLLIL